MKNIVVLFLCITCTMGALHAQTAKFDYYKGDYEVWKRGLKVMNYMEKKKLAALLPLMSATSGIDSVKLKAIEAGFLKQYAALKDVNVTNDVVPADGGGKDTPDFYERTYYSVNNNTITYYMQVLITMDANGSVQSIALLDKNTLVKRDKIILNKLKENAQPPAAK